MSNRLKTWYEKATTLPDEFNPNVSMKETFYNAPFKIIDGCHFYSFPLGLLSIINLLTIVAILGVSIYIMYTGVMSLDYRTIFLGFIILFGGMISNSFMFFIQAYLIKGCQCAKINSKKKLVIQNDVKNLNTNPENKTP